MRYLLAAIALGAGLAGCGGGGGGGGGGSGGSAVPDSYCEGYTYVTPHGNVEQSTECGWEDPILSIKVDGVGTIFKPAVVSVNVTQWGDAADWTYETDGRVDRDGDKLYVYNTEDAVGLTTINVLGETIEVTLAPLPRCELNGSYDCEGYEVGGYAEPLVYFGPGDTQLVEVELTFLRPRSGATKLEAKEDTKSEESWVQGLNDLMEESGTYLRLKLQGVYYFDYSNLERLRVVASGLPTDLVHMYGYSKEGTCGIAYAAFRFIEGEPQVSMSMCGLATVAHELGHSMGLAHGPENGSNNAVGYIFPQFGHGWNNICGYQDGIMSYGAEPRYFTNSLVECMYGGVRGDRQYTDSAYAINRVRYDVALIHNEYSTNTTPTPAARSLETLDVIVVD